MTQSRGLLYQLDLCRVADIDNRIALVPNDLASDPDFVAQVEEVLGLIGKAAQIADGDEGSKGTLVRVLEAEVEGLAVIEEVAHNSLNCLYLADMTAG